MGYSNISLRIGDGSAGWPEHAPYHRIMVTAGCAALPPPLLDQLAPGGRMVAPVGPRMEQDLLLVTRPLDGPLRIESVMKVIFVELVGPYGWSPADRG
jgi:protein-L-isoaspartate(D-aspartate) O-methyltransferase